MCIVCICVRVIVLKELSSAITKSNLDLLTHFEPLLSSEQSDFMLKVEELQVKCNTLGSKANGDIISLKVFCTYVHKMTV